MRGVSLWRYSSLLHFSYFFVSFHSRLSCFIPSKFLSFRVIWRISVACNLYCIFYRKNRNHFKAYGIAWIFLKFSRQCSKFLLDILFQEACKSGCTNWVPDNALSNASVTKVQRLSYLCVVKKRKKVNQCHLSDELDEVKKRRKKKKCCRDWRITARHDDTLIC